MRLLAIETSCDETSAAVVERNDSNVTLLSNTTASSAKIHAQTGGIIPEQAARAQILSIIPVIAEALLNSEGITAHTKSEELTIAREIISKNIDGIAVTVGPGLIGSLLVGVETAKTLAYIFKKPIFNINHLLGHLYANFITTDSSDKNIQFPFIGLIVSGGHTDLLHFKSHSEYTWIGGTRDDAAGEALDKIGRMIQIPYPAGADIEKRAELIKSSTLQFQSPLLHNTNTFDFSFSGLKTEVMRYVKDKDLSEELINNVCFATQEAIVKVLVKKTLQALNQYKTNTLIIGGGVAANNLLRKRLVQDAERLQIPLTLIAPPAYLCADNAAMIGARALMAESPSLWQSTLPQPELYFS